MAAKCITDSIWKAPSLYSEQSQNVKYYFQKVKRNIRNVKIIPSKKGKKSLGVLVVSMRIPFDGVINDGLNYH